MLYAVKKNEKKCVFWMLNERNWFRTTWRYSYDLDPIKPTAIKWYESYNRIQNRENTHNTYNLYSCYSSWHYYPVKTKSGKVVTITTISYQELKELDAESECYHKPKIYDILLALHCNVADKLMKLPNIFNINVPCIWQIHERHLLLDSPDPDKKDSNNFHALWCDKGFGEAFHNKTPTQRMVDGKQSHENRQLFVPCWRNNQFEMILLDKYTQIKQESLTDDDRNDLHHQMGKEYTMMEYMIYRFGKYKKEYQKWIRDGINEQHNNRGYAATGINVHVTPQ